MSLSQDIADLEGDIRCIRTAINILIEAEKSRLVKLGELQEKQRTEGTA